MLQAAKTGSLILTDIARCVSMAAYQPKSGQGETRGKASIMRRRAAVFLQYGDSNTEKTLRSCRLQGMGESRAVILPAASGRVRQGPGRSPQEKPRGNRGPQGRIPQERGQEAAQCFQTWIQLSMEQGAEGLHHPASYLRSLRETCDGYRPYYPPQRGQGSLLGFYQLAALMP